MDEQGLQRMSVEILTDIKAWRRAHPRATYVEIEDEVHKRMMQLEARLIAGWELDGSRTDSGSRGYR